MPICEMCGASSSKAKRVFLEGSLLMLCPNCARFGQVPEEREEERGPVAPVKVPAPYTGKGGSTQGRSLDVGEVVLKEDYHKVIGEARNRMGLTQDKLARKLNERKSVIAKLESKQLRPNDALRKKLERTLHIVLTERISGKAFQVREERRGLTIGDMIKRQKKG